LSRERRRDGLRRNLKGRLERIADDFVHVPAMLDDSSAQDRVMARERSTHLLRLTFPQGCAAFDVRVEKGDGA
jgi:hypothetical protein